MTEQLGQNDGSGQYLFVGSYTGFEPGQLGWVGSKQPGVGIHTNSPTI